MTVPRPTTGGLPGIDVEPVTAWLVRTLPNMRAPLSFDVLAGGHSNLTYLVTDSHETRVVLRRPPLGHVLATAHDMVREHRIVQALGASNVPVPACLGLCADASVNGPPFYVMDFVDGHVVRDQPSAEAALDVSAREQAGLGIADVLAKLHALNVEAIGLGHLGRHDGYIDRQLRRWDSQFKASNEKTGRPVPLMDEVHDVLAARIPRQQGVALVHGDFRLDNCMVADDGTVIAVLDWEICTLGDPLADLGLLQVYWTDRDNPEPSLLVAPTLAEGFPTSAELMARYATQSDRDLTDLDYYTAFGFWKLAAIVEGVYSRYAGGALGDDATGFEGFSGRVPRLAERAAEAAERLS